MFDRGLPLPEEEKRRFAKRLESFSDIVFGFALAQCAISLELPRSLGDAPVLVPRLLLFVITFVLVATFWAMHYRMFRWMFAAERIDIALNVALLGDVALLPFALQLFFRFRGAPLAYAGYGAVLGVAFGLLALLSFRGFRKYQPTIPAAMQLGLWRSVVRHAVSAIVLLGSLPLILRYGSEGNAAWLVVPVALVVIPRLIRRAPAFRGGALEPDGDHAAGIVHP